MHKIADAIEGGTLKHLSGVRQRTHIVQLESSLRIAQVERALEERKKAEETGSHYEGSQVFDKHYERDPEIGDIEHTEFPWPSLSGYAVQNIVEKFDQIPKSRQQGLKRTANKLRKLKKEHDDGRHVMHNFDTEASMDELNQIVRQVKKHGQSHAWDWTEHAADSLRDFRRMRAMDWERSEPKVIIFASSES